MPYAYRSMTPDERAEVVHIRRDRGYPLHAPPHPYRDSGCYFITAANYEHAHIILDTTRRTDFEARLLAAMAQIEAHVHGWVILSNHYHLLIEIDKLDSVSMALKKLHGSTSHEWNLADAQVGSRRVWYKYTDRFIRNEPHFYKALNYIHINPVKHGYTADAYDWPWCSVQLYTESAEHGRDWLRQKWQLHPPGNLSPEWGD